jgi:hypothetical protein
MPPSNEYLIMKMNACFQAAAVGLNMLERAACDDTLRKKSARST